jgi:hypothetical protein
MHLFFPYLLLGQVVEKLFISSAFKKTIFYVPIAESLVTHAVFAVWIANRFRRNTIAIHIRN